MVRRSDDISVSEHLRSQIVPSPKFQSMTRLPILSLALVMCCSGLMLLLTPHVTWGQMTPASTSALSSPELLQSFVQVTLNDGSLKYGTLLSMDDNDVVLDIAGLGATRIPKYLIQSLSALDVSAEEVERGYNYVSNQPSRYFFAPSGHQLAKGEGYFQSNVALNSISYGFTDHFTGGVIISVLGAGITAKYGGQVSENVHMSIGGIAGSDYYGNLDRPLVLGFANVTLGDENKNLTFNVGMGNRFDDGMFYSGLTVDSVYQQSWDGNYYWNTEYTYATRNEEYQNPFLFNVSGMLPLMPNRWFITENYLVIPTFRRAVATDENPAFVSSYPAYNTEAQMRSEPGGGVSIGIRSYNKQSGWLWDYGLAGVFGAGGGFPVPWFSFTLEF